MFITAVNGIVCFSMEFFPNNPFAFQVPMAVIGKVYANSMLVLLNSRMLLISEEAPLISVVNFAMAPTTDTHV